MKTILGIKGFALSEYAISGNALLGIRDSGKTYAGCEAAEELFDAGVPSICFDPIGKWHSLRVPAKGGKGYPFVVAGGKFGDLPLTRKNVAELVRGAMTDGISLVLDLFSKDMTKADWRYIVASAMEILLYENEDHGMRHVFIEEAGEFVPQIVRDGTTFNAVEKVVRMGGNSKLGVTLIHQRPADINKSVLELCANVILLKQSGKNTVTDLKKWTAIMAPEMASKVAATLPHLKPGNGWAFIAGIPAPFQFKVPTRKSKHPDRREAAAAGAAPRAAVPATEFVEAMKAKLAAAAPKPKAPAAAPANETAKSYAGRAPVEFSKEQVHAVDYEQGRKAGADEMRDRVPALLDGQHAVSFQMGVDWARGAAIVAAKSIPNPDLMPARRPLDGLKAILAAKAPPPRDRADAVADLVGVVDDTLTRVIERRSTRFLKPTAQVNQAPRNGLGKAEAAILGVVAHFPRHGVSKAKAALMAGYSSKSGSFRNTLSMLRTADLLHSSGETLFLTDAGLAAAGPLEPLPTGSALLDYWTTHSAVGKCEAAILTVLVKELQDHPDNPVLPKDEIGARTGYEATSGSFRNGLSRLRTLGLIEGSKVLRAAEAFA